MEKSMQLKDPIHGIIEIDDQDILELIQTNAFQRLTHIKQQGHTYLLHPNALHTRIEHSLGVYELIKRLIIHLLGKRDVQFTPYEIKVAKIAALLHDIGHGPFSHCFQTISGQDHGDWTIRIVEDTQEIITILNRTPNLLQDVLLVLRGEGAFPIIEELLFGSLSMDQMDFWNRDLFYSNIDMDPINMNNFIATMSYTENKLVISIDGIPYVEKLMDIKRALYEKGFGHPFVVGKDLLLKEIFKEVKNENVQLQSSNLSKCISSDEQDIKVLEYLSLNDETIQNEIEYLKTYDNEFIQQLAHLYLSVNESLPWAEIDIEHQQMDGHTVVAVMKEKKNYSSYSGGVFIEQGSELVDIATLSSHVHSSFLRPAKQYIYFLKS